MEYRKTAILFVITVSILAGTASLPAVAKAKESYMSLTTSEQRKLLAEYATSKNRNSLVIDSNLSYSQAMGDSVVPEGSRELHAQMKPYLRVVSVIYWGYDDKVHLGQIVVHKELVQDTNQLFLRMFTLKFPIQSVIPQAQFGYEDEQSMLANNSSNYRPSRLGSGNLSEHAKAAAFDLNPLVNPMIVTDENGVTTVDPPGAHYNPNAQGAITKNSEIRKLWTSLHYEWGGNWGDPNADPLTDFYRVNYFDYQHFQLDYTRIEDLSLPAGL